MLECIAPGLLATIQDTGRYGMQSQGIGTAGAMDVFALRVANALLGNPRTAPALEITLGGAEFIALETAWYALCGADLGATLDGTEVPLCAPFRMTAGQRLRLPAARRGQRACLAISGGFVADVVFGSASTDLRCGFGGLLGRGLTRGDRLFSRGLCEPARLPSRVFTSLAHPALVSQEPLALLPGPALALLSAEDRERFLHQSFTVSRASDRMGLRLEQALASAARLPQALSEPVAFGTVQLPPDGKCIVLGADRQTTGGYPVAGVVASVDHGRLAQLRPGETLRFRVTGFDEAHRAWQAREKQIAQLAIVAGAWWKDER